MDTIGTTPKQSVASEVEGGIKWVKVQNCETYPTRSPTSILLQDIYCIHGAATIAPTLDDVLCLRAYSIISLGLHARGAVQDNRAA